VVASTEVLVVDGSVRCAAGRVAYRDLGGSGPPVILVHGLGGNLAHWGRVAPLVRDKHRLVSIDLPSHGGSTAPAGHSLDQDVAAIDAVRRHLGLEQPVVVGHSYGGMLAVALGAARPTDYRGVVNVDGIACIVDEDDGTASSPEAFSEEDLATSGDDEWLERQIDRDLDEVAALRLRLDRDDEILRRAYQPGGTGRWHRSPTLQRLIEINEALDGWQLLPVYAASSCPTVTVVAERRDAPTEELAAARRDRAERVRTALAGIGAVLETVPTGHYPHVESPEMTAARFSGWVGF